MKNFSRFSLIFLCFVLVTSNAFSVEKKDINILNENLPDFMGASNAGKEFYLTFHPSWEVSEGTNNFIRIYISSSFKTNVKLEIPGIKIIKNLETIPNGIIEIDLHPQEGQMYSAYENLTPPLPENVWTGRAIKITADDPIVCYGVLRYQFTADGFLALPVHSWGKNYQVASYTDPTNSKKYFQPSYTSIMAAYDNTEVTFKLGGSTTAGVLLQNYDTLRIGQSIKRVLNTGDVWLIPGIGEYNDLTGSQISADKFIGVISGNFCAYIPTHIAGCDYIIEQENPIEFWGKNYYVPTIFGRINFPIIKMFAKEPKTQVYCDGVPMWTITTPGGYQGVGFIEARAGVEPTPRPVTINSDKAINVVLYNPGQQDDNRSSDPFQMNILPEEQYQKEVSFNTPGITGSFGFRDNYLNIILKSKDGKIPDDMQIGTIVNDTVQWVKLKDYTSDSLVAFIHDVKDKDGYLHYSKTIKLSIDGVYKLKADKPFGVHGYGFGDYDSYGFQYSNAMIDQTSKDTLAPTISAENLGIGVYKGQVKDRGVIVSKTDKNKDDFQQVLDIAGLSFVEMINGLSDNYKFERDDFVSGETNGINFKVSKILEYKDSKAFIYASDRRGNDTTLILTDLVSSRSFAPIITSDSADFGTLKNGQKKQLTLKLKNPGLKTSKSVLELVFENNNPDFKIISPLNFPFTLKVNEEIDLIVEFTGGTVDSVFTNRIGVKTTDTTLYRIELKAKVANPIIKTTDVDYSTCIIDKDINIQYIYLSNSGNSVLIINKIDFPKNNVFNVFQEPPLDVIPFNIDTGKTVTILAEFKPKVPGEFKDSIVFYSDGKIVKNVSYLKGKAIVNSVKEFENKYGVINLSVKDNKISFSAGNDIILNSYSIYDLTGKITLTGSPAALLNNYNINIGNISGSVYFIELNTQYGKVVKKIVVE